MDRNYILTEIKRTADQNGGRPLGRMRFYTETGIKESDWLGKYWTKWSDALAEAGYTANSMQLAYDEEFLLEKLAELIQELGHYPTEAELRLKAHQTGDFPSHNTFRRLGTRSEIVGKLIGYCVGQEGYAGVIEVCIPLVKPTSSVRDVSVDPSSDNIGSVYLLKAGRYYKIGRSNVVGRRERELAIQLPERPKLIDSIRTDDPPGIEAYWHRRFAAQRKNGEWFDLSASDIAAFRRRKFM